MKNKKVELRLRVKWVVKLSLSMIKCCMFYICVLYCEIAYFVAIYMMRRNNISNYQSVYRERTILLKYSTKLKYLARYGSENNFIEL